MSSFLRESDVRGIYRAVLGRDPESQALIDDLVSQQITTEELIRRCMGSGEFAAMSNAGEGASERAIDFAKHNGRHYLFPRDLVRTSIPVRRVLLVGSCMLDRWPEILRRERLQVDVDRLLLTSQPPDAPPHPAEDYSFQIVQIPLREVVPDHLYLRWVRSSFTDAREADEIFSMAKQRVDFWLERALVWSDKILTFVMNFLRPQQNLNGRLFPRYDMRNNIYFFEELNRYLAESLERKRGAYLIDADNLASSFGRRFVQDDAVWISIHGGFLSDADRHADANRIVKTPPASAHYSLDDTEFICTLWLEAEAMFRSLSQVDPVKMVCVDIDDTIWRGVLAEGDSSDFREAVEGWPMGIAEALLTLKRRGVLLALVSKNHESRIREIWPRVFPNLISMDDFAIVKVNWRTKVENIGEAMREANLLPRNVVFLDDNPTERGAVAQAFPQVRVIEAAHHYWKRVLLWSAETQSAQISNESGRRSEMIKAQVEREISRQAFSRDEFLANLDLRVTFRRIEGEQSRQFARTLELLNKTNQFNTTGRRWTHQELNKACGDGLVLVGEARDRFAEYGLVLVAIMIGNLVEQVVMSCRVIGLDVELAAISALTSFALGKSSVIRAETRSTDVNLLSRDLFSRSGWKLQDGLWQTDVVSTSPKLVTVEMDASLASYSVH